MTDLTETEIEKNVEDDEEDLDDFIDEDDDWEDRVTYEKILSEVPDGWQLVKVFAYTYQTLEQMREWCVENCQAAYKEVNWSSGCSYSTGVMFEFDMDVVLFKLRWGGI